MGPKTLLVLVCAASLVTGAALGVAADRMALEARADVRGAPRGSYADRFIERLELDAKQAEAVRAILEKHRPRFQAVMDEVRPRLRALHEEIDAELRPLLRPEQQVRLEAMRREREERAQNPKN